MKGGGGGGGGGGGRRMRGSQFYVLQLPPGTTH